MPKDVRRTIGELLAEMNLDRKRKILFVEGTRDLSFWRKIVPPAQRKNSVVYTISSIQVNFTEGGERGRLVCLSKDKSLENLGSRIKFFIDADYDRILSRVIPDNIILTDGRDLESYVTNYECLEEVVINGLAKTDIDFKKILDDVFYICRPIGILRVFSEKSGLKLPFQLTFDKGYKRFIKTKKEHYSLDIEKLIVVLLQNSGISMSNFEDVKNCICSETKLLADVDNFQIIHGKDFMGILAYFLSIESHLIESMMFLSINCNRLLEFSNINLTSNYLVA